MKNSKKVLLFQVKKDKEAKIRDLCGELGMEAVVVEPKQYLEPLGMLAAVPGIPRSGKVYQGMVMPMEMMIFSGINQDFLDIFLQKYKEHAIEPIALKAVLTPTNIFWNTKQLQEELWKEHQSIGKL